MAWVLFVRVARYLVFQPRITLASCHRCHHLRKLGRRLHVPRHQRREQFNGKNPKEYTLDVLQFQACLLSLLYT
jgi:hypothetical protein